MRKAVCSPSVLRGTVAAPPSKSMAHRLILCAALAKGVSTIKNLDFSCDITATLDAVRALGAKVTCTQNSAVIDGSELFAPRSVQVNCRESGSTLRFLLPIAAAGGMTVRFTGEGKLPQRPVKELTSLLEGHGTECFQGHEGLPLTIFRRLRGGTYTLPGNISSQYITGLLFALPLCTQDSEIHLTTPLESRGYVELTLEALRQAGIEILSLPDGWRVPGNQQYRPHDAEVEGDWSQAAFYLAAGTLGGDIRITGLDRDSVQGDRACLALFERFGATIHGENDVLCCKAGELVGQEIDAAQIPDLVPILAVTGAFCKGVTTITRAQRLRLKESDRLASVADNLIRLGGAVDETEDGLRITGGLFPCNGTEISGYNDHRIVMAFAVAALRAQGPVTISDAHAITKSYPGFFKAYNQLGGKADVINLG